LILYLHGFRSSPQSRKARMVAAAMASRGRADDFLCPQLPASPRAAARLIEAAARLEDPRRLALIGSSLGGYYATWLAERLGCRAALLNPAITPYEDLRGHLGPQAVFFSAQTIEVKPEYMDELHALDTPRISRPERYFLLAATGDEVIDWRTMAAKYAGCRQRIIDGSSHELADFASHLDEVLAFCGVAAPQDGRPPVPASSTGLPASARRVQDALDALAVGSRVVELPVAARTSQQAAEALGVEVGRIAKSLVFRGGRTSRPVLVIAAGDRRVDEGRVSAALGEPIERASPEFVREHTGFAIGGVAPLGHPQPLSTLVDASLRRFDTVWAAGGTPHCVFPIAPAALLAASGGREIETG
jgi:predicted esterase YcpF (UPF0227 family)/prolyl-tRNA editing enzyme YbaK/EbsC (Cys-tRNA(Pro) deacylase)